MMLSNLKIPAMLGLKDLWDDRYVSLCVVAALVAVVAPLMLLFGLKNGIVYQLKQELQSNPGIKELKLVGNHQLTRDWINQLADRKEVGFVIPTTRSLNAEVDIMKSSNRFMKSLELIPSAKGDPLLQTDHGTLSAPNDFHDIVLSDSVARKLDAVIDDTVTVVINRKLDGVSERARIKLTITGIIADSVYPRPLGMVSLDMLEVIENFKDGYSVEELSVLTGQVKLSSRNSYAKVRVYANTLDNVAPLQKWIEEEHIQVITQSQQIESVKAIDRLLTLIFSIIAWTAVVGALASLAGAFLSSIDRKRKSLALLQLMGLVRKQIVMFMVFQAAVIAIVAYIGALLFFAVGKLSFDNALASYMPKASYVCYLGIEDLISICIMTLFASIVVSSVGSYQALKIQPAESLRDA